MKKSAIAGAALFAGFALAAPLSAYSQAQPQTAPEQQQNRGTAGDRMGAPGMGAQGMGMMGMGMMGAGMRGDNDDEGMGWRRRGMHEQMHRRMHDRSGFGGMGGGMMHRSPTERCQERLARHMAMITYTVTKLDLSDEQRPLWDRLNAILQDGTKRQLALCRSLPTSEQQGEATILDRVSRAEQFLSTRLQMLQQARPALEQFYQALNPQQKQIVNHPWRQG
jgi:hypothetical protein